MIAVAQRVSSASVVVEQGPGAPHRAEIGAGLVALIGVERGDGDDAADWLADKLAALRIFADGEGKMNRSVTDVGGSALVISQFTLVGDARKGNRPSFVDAAPPEVAAPLVERVATRLELGRGVPVGRGVFGASMRVTLVNEGPVTIILGRPPDG